MRRILLFIVIIMSTMLIGCSSMASNKPDDVDQDIWDKVAQYTMITKDFYDSETNIVDTSLPERVTNFRDEYFETDLTEAETDLINDLVNLNISLLEDYIHSTGGSRQSVEDDYAVLVETYGEDELDISNLDVEIIGLEDYNELFEEVELIRDTANTVTVEDVMEEGGVNLTNADVQYDMVNNLDEEFAIIGIAELSDYYNYGFTNEESYFVARVTPDNGGYSDSWYLYFHRESFNDLYDVLLAGNIKVKATAVVPEGVYKKGQGNMAQVTSAGIVN